MSLASQPHWSGQQTIPVHINSFGAFVRYLREREQLAQRDLTTAFPQYFEEHRASPFLLNPDMYRKLEKGYRAAQYEELLPLYATLLGCGCKLSVQECHAFVRLARQKLESLRTRRPKPRPDGEWRMLESRLLQLARHTGAAEEPGTLRSQERLRPRLLSFDTSHLVGREEWLENLLSYFPVENRKKLVVISGMMGVGKTSGLKLLLSHFLEQEECYPLLYTFPTSSTENLKPADHLQAFLATVLTEFGLGEPEATKMVSLEVQVKQVLTQLAQLEQRVVFLLDDAQQVLDGAGQLTPEWEQFLAAYLGAEHQAIIYLAAREWPLWLGRNRSFVIDGDTSMLPTLAASACVTLWQRLGFTDVAEELLYRATERCGNNPLMIELRAASLQRPRFSFGWGHRGSQSQKAHKNEHEQLLEEMLEETHVFSAADGQARQFLQQVISQRLSRDALELLEMLSVPSIVLPFPLLAEGHAQAEYAFSELLRNGLLDREALVNDRARLLPLVREAGLATMGTQRYQELEQHLLRLYEIWLDAPDFLDDQEQGLVVTELLILLLKQSRFLQASELLLRYGWLCTLFGHVTRIQRVYEEMMLRDRGKEVDVAREVGCTILQHRLAVHCGQKVERDWRDRIYRDIHQKMVVGEVRLQAHSELEVLHNMLLLYSRSGQLAEASSLFEQTFERLQQSGQMTSEVYALFLSSKTRLLCHWWDKLGNAHGEEIQNIQQKCIITFREGIAQWRLCLKNALPLQEHYYHFKMARVLNDYAYRLRLIGDLDEAQAAIEESLCLKKAGNALPHSVAISLSEYAQILALKGQIRKALPAKEEAIEALERLSNDGDISHNSELGVFLFEHASILKQQARLEEAKAELVKAIPLIGNKPTRQHFRLQAEQDLEGISLILETGQLYQLDKRWFSRYLELASYKEVDWIAAAGPFLDEEQVEWRSLYPKREKEEIADRLKALIVQSQQREFGLSYEEKRAPRLWYPHIPLEEVQDRIKKFGQLRHDIEQEEENAVVCSLYTDVINEQIIRLRQYEATALGNQDAVWRCNLALYGKPSTHEFYIALQALCKMVLEAQNHEQAGPVAQDVLRQLEAWGLFPQEIVAMQFLSSKQEPVPSFKQKLVEGEREFSPLAVQRFFQDVLTHEYQAEDWQVEIEPTRTGAGIDVNLKTLYLPPKPFSLEKIRELLAEEIEVHAYRSLSGLRSPLALLGSGLARYNATEEGLAKHSIQQISQQMQSEERSKTWIWTLATGLASGVLTPALSFYELAVFLQKRFLIEKLLSNRSLAWGKAVVAARQLAWARTTRAFRGVPHLEEAGCCSLKDVIYLRGYLGVKQALEQVGEERFLVGKVGVEHLDAMSELNILAPFCPHRHLALAPDLYDRVFHYEK